MNLLQKALSKILRPASARTQLDTQKLHFQSSRLQRIVEMDVYLPVGYFLGSGPVYPTIIFNDGQDLQRMDFATIFRKQRKTLSAIVIGVYASERRLREYGTARQADYKGRGDLASEYAQFIVEELLPSLRKNLGVSAQADQLAIAGFSLGGLSALDIAWAHPEVFGSVGVFSGSLWWRSAAVREEDPDADRIMHDIVQTAAPAERNQRFWFQVGTLDEQDDRNNNGVIDAIDDTLDLMQALRGQGIPEASIRYVAIENGRHEPVTWGKAMPDFLRWVFAKNKRG